MFASMEQGLTYVDIHTSMEAAYLLNMVTQVLKPGLVKGPWTKEEDKIVLDTVMEHGVGKGPLGFAYLSLDG